MSQKEDVKTCPACGGAAFCGCGACLNCSGGGESSGMCYACIDDA